MKLDVNGIELYWETHAASTGGSASFSFRQCALDVAALATIAVRTLVVFGARIPSRLATVECAIVARVCDLRASETGAANQNTVATDTLQAGWRHALVFERLGARVRALLLCRATSMNDWFAPPRVLIVDDSDEQVRLLKRVLAAEGCDCEAIADGRRACEAALAVAPDAILLDVELPHLDGLSICRQLKNMPETALIPVLIMTGQVGSQHHLAALEAGADDFLPKPTSVAALRARLRSAIKLKRSIDGLDDAAGSILMLASALEARDPSTKGHCDRLADYGVRLGRRLGLGLDDLRALHLGGYLHDLGKIAVPDAVLYKPGRLTAAEYELIKAHPLVGDRICAPMRTLQHVRPIVRSHHELIDGSGYPDGLSGSRVPLLAQIIAIVDVYDALTSDRPYHAAMSADSAFAELRAEAAAGKRETVLVEEFIAMQRSETLAVAS